MVCPHGQGGYFSILCGIILRTAFKARVHTQNRIFVAAAYSFKSKQKQKIK